MALFSASELDQLWSLLTSERRRDLESAWLAHGDFDATAIFYRDGRYSGLIDFGEIRGTEPLFDLGHSSCTTTSPRPSPWRMTSSPATARSLPSRTGTSSWFAGRRSCLAYASSPGG